MQGTVAVNQSERNRKRSSAELPTAMPQAQGHCQYLLTDLIWQIPVAAAVRERWSPPRAQLLLECRKSDYETSSKCQVFPKNNFKGLTLSFHKVNNELNVRVSKNLYPHCPKLRTSICKASKSLSQFAYIKNIFKGSKMCLLKSP